MKHRFETLETDMNNQAAKVATVNELARQLLHVDHPNSEEILQRQNKLNARSESLIFCLEFLRLCLHSRSQLYLKQFFCF